MSETPTREWLALQHMDKLVDVSDGAIIKGPGVYLVRADRYDMVADQRDVLKEEARVNALLAEHWQAQCASAWEVSTTLIGVLNDISPPDEKQLLVSYAEVKHRLKAILAKAQEALDT